MGMTSTYYNNPTYSNFRSYRVNFTFATPQPDANYISIIGF